MDAQGAKIKSKYNSKYKIDIKKKACKQKVLQAKNFHTVRSIGF